MPTILGNVFDDAEQQVLVCERTSEMERDRASFDLWPLTILLILPTGSLHGVHFKYCGKDGNYEI